MGVWHKWNEPIFSSDWQKRMLNSQREELFIDIRYMFSLDLMFCQIMSYLAQLFCILACYLLELHCLIVCYLAEMFCQIVSYSAEQQHKITFLELNLKLVFIIVVRKMLFWRKLSLIILPNMLPDFLWLEQIKILKIIWKISVYLQVMENVSQRPKHQIHSLVNI